MSHPKCIPTSSSFGRCFGAYPSRVAPRRLRFPNFTIELHQRYKRCRFSIILRSANEYPHLPISRCHWPYDGLPDFFHQSIAFVCKYLRLDIQHLRPSWSLDHTCTFKSEHFLSLETGGIHSAWRTAYIHTHASSSVFVHSDPHSEQRL
jgi:hypothetical protein